MLDTCVTCTNVFNPSNKPVKGAWLLYLFHGKGNRGSEKLHRLLEFKQIDVDALEAVASAP